MGCPTLQIMQFFFVSNAFDLLPPTLSIFGHNKRTILGEFWLPIYVQLSISPESSEQYFRPLFVSNHPLSQTNSQAHKVMLHLPSPLMTGATFKCQELPFDSPDVTLVYEDDLQLQGRTGWFWQRQVFKEKRPDHKAWRVAHLRDPSSNSFFYYGRKQTG